MPNNSIALIGDAGNHYVSRNHFCHRHRRVIEILTITALVAVFLLYAFYFVKKGFIDSGELSMNI